jgi:hypothetical protein
VFGEIAQTDAGAAECLGQRGIGACAFARVGAQFAFEHGRSLNERDSGAVEFEHACAPVTLLVRMGAKIPEQHVLEAVETHAAREWRHAPRTPRLKLRGAIRRRLMAGRDV